ncbi:MAG: DUF4290 domain-containing protein [Bacteroidales bacterium]|nr:DUF4290 domain-containing protein [Bacteroidales bacterium]
MEYNTERKELIIPEYGRNIQKMVENAMKIEDREKRTEYANSIIASMNNVNPDAKNILDYKHKLWDHLYIISDYKLDVDSPYPMPDKVKIQSQPQKLSYKNSKIEFGPYGMLIEKMIETIIQMEDGEEKQELISLLAQQLKKSYLQWNRDSVDDELILKHFEQLSKGMLKLQEDFKLNTTRNILNSGSKKRTGAKGQIKVQSKNQNKSYTGGTNQKRSKFIGQKFNRNQK